MQMNHIQPVVQIFAKLARATAPSKSLLVAAMMRTSMGMDSRPRATNFFLCRARSSFAVRLTGAPRLHRGTACPRFFKRSGFPFDGAGEAPFVAEELSLSSSGSWMAAQFSAGAIGAQAMLMDSACDQL
jgi:hypothetical protein